jgi:hypothetical protein
VRLVTIGELDAHREESPELIGIEAVRISARPWKCSEQKSWNCCLAESGTSDVQYSQGLHLSLEERVRRKLILAGILPKLSNLIRRDWSSDRGCGCRAVRRAS